MSNLNNKLIEVRLNTKKDLKEKLEQHKRCALVRCTGFGKTWLLSDISQDYKSVLYLYPAEIIKQTAITAISSTRYISEAESEKLVKNEIEEELGYKFNFYNIRFMTYNKLARMKRKEIESLPNYELIIFDELHRIGGEKTKSGSFFLIYSQENAHIIGATATPDRSDAFDVINEFFKGICVYPYTLHDAVKDGIIKMPYYVYCTFDIESSLKSSARKVGQDLNDPIVKEVLNSRMLDVCKIHNMPTIIRKTVDAYVKDTSYMKYIVFFSSINQLHSKKKDVLDWFSQAFPTHKLNILEVTSENVLTRENLYAMNFIPNENTINIIACVDMLNMGYHVNDLTGIVMYRCTESSTIYIQQLGRVLSTGQENHCVVFDVVDNLHRKSIFKLSISNNTRRRTIPTTKKDRAKKILDVIREELDPCEISLIEKFIEDNLMVSDEESFKIVWNKINEIKKEDIIAIDHLASYREMVAKIVSEVKYERIKRACEEYFRIAYKKAGKELPRTVEELKKVKNAPPELAIFLNWQKVSEEDVFQYIDPDNTGNIDVDKISNDIKQVMMAY